MHRRLCGMHPSTATPLPLLPAATAVASTCASRSVPAAAVNSTLCRVAWRAACDASLSALYALCPPALALHPLALPAVVHHHRDPRCPAGQLVSNRCVSVCRCLPPRLPLPLLHNCLHKCLHKCELLTQ